MLFITISGQDCFILEISSSFKDVWFIIQYLEQGDVGERFLNSHFILLQKVHHYTWMHCLSFFLFIEMKIRQISKLYRF